MQKAAESEVVRVCSYYFALAARQVATWPASLARSPDVFRPCWSTACTPQVFQSEATPAAAAPAAKSAPKAKAAAAPAPKREVVESTSSEGLDPKTIALPGEGRRHERTQMVHGHQHSHASKNMPRMPHMNQRRCSAKGCLLHMQEDGA